MLLLHEEGLLNIREVYTDGTKIEANANRYTFVWGNPIKNNRARISTRLKELWEYAGSVAEAELDFVNPSPEKVSINFSSIKTSSISKQMGFAHRANPKSKENQF